MNVWATMDTVVCDFLWCVVVLASNGPRRSGSDAVLCVSGLATAAHTTRGVVSTIRTGAVRAHVGSGTYS